ncbi:MAG: hypothetical protein VXW15_07205, partial [Bdellovibrionota bacterium]|nr:hypothetical protein [Bdellovibrionota bacterium]
MTLQKTVNELQKQLDSVLKFPDQNPNPVLKIDLNGKLLYQNKAGIKISSYWCIELNEVVPDEIILHAKKELTTPLELVCGNKTFSFHIVPVPELHFICIYGTDITAMKAITKFPDQNPNPVLKINNEGRLLYFNQAATSIQKAWGIQIGEQVPNKILKVSHNTSNHPTNEPLELEIKNKTYNFHIV